MKKSIISIFIFITLFESIYSVDIIPGIFLSCIMPFYSGNGFSDNYLGELEDAGYSSLKNNPKLSMGIGISFELSFNDYIAIQPEILFTSNGGGVRGTNSDSSSFTRLIDETTLEIPLLLKGIIPLEKDRFYFIAGPVLTVLIGTPVIRDKNGVDFNNENLSRKDFSIWGVAAEVGCGYDFSFRDGYFFLEGRYSYEFTDSMIDHGNNFNQNTIYFNCGYRFGTQS